MKNPSCGPLPGRDDGLVCKALDPQPAMHYSVFCFAIENVATALPATSQLVGKASFFLLA
jgi:hypothetical protein